VSHINHVHCDGCGDPDPATAAAHLRLHHPNPHRTTLIELLHVATRREEAAAEYEAADAVWRDRIVAALRRGVPVAEIASTLGISRARVYQIRDGRR
jgi:hypothetical protein